MLDTMFVCSTEKVKLVGALETYGDMTDQQVLVGLKKGNHGETAHKHIIYLIKTESKAHHYLIK